MSGSVLRGTLQEMGTVDPEGQESDLHAERLSQRWIRCVCAPPQTCELGSYEGQRRHFNSIEGRSPRNFLLTFVSPTVTCAHSDLHDWINRVQLRQSPLKL